MQSRRPDSHRQVQPDRQPDRPVHPDRQRGTARQTDRNSQTDRQVQTDRQTATARQTDRYSQTGRQVQPDRQTGTARQVPARQAGRYSQTDRHGPAAAAAESAFCLFRNFRGVLKEDSIPRGCKLRSFKMEMKALFEIPTLIPLKTQRYKDFFLVSNIHVCAENMGSGMWSASADPGYTGIVEETPDCE